MEPIDILVQVLASGVPAALVVLGSYTIFKHLIRAESRRQTGDMRMHAFTHILPLRLSAYERAMLFLERLNPANCLQRHNQTPLSGLQLYDVVTNEIEQEYEHNAVQQLYISEAGWTMLSRTKLDVITILREVKNNMPENASGLDFSQAVFERMKLMEENTLQIAIRVLRNDISQLSRQPQ